MNNQTIRQTPVLRVAVYFSLLYQLDTETLRHKLYNSSVYLNMPVLTFWISRHYHRYMSYNNSIVLNSCIKNVKIIYWIRYIFLSLISSMIIYLLFIEMLWIWYCDYNSRGKQFSHEWLAYYKHRVFLRHMEMCINYKTIGMHTTCVTFIMFWFNIISHPE